jgi:hypothetical protein
MSVSCSTASTTPAERRPLGGLPRRSGLRRLALLVAAGCLVAAGACRSAVAPPAIDDVALGEAREALSGPLPGDLSALYHLRVPSSGALRLAVLERGGEGRLTVSEPFGGAVSVTSWAPGRTARVFDLREGCWQDAGQAAAGLGAAAMPLPQAVRLLGGRLPAVAGDRVDERPGVGFEVAGEGWRALVEVAPGPWRVTEVSELAPAGTSGWRIRLGDHTRSVPGRVRIDGAGRGWAELELVHLEWGGSVLPGEPDLPPCGSPPGDPR